MPNFDKTGPNGQGPMTGRSDGPCASGYGRGSGRGLGRGLGRGFANGIGRGMRNFFGRKFCCDTINPKDEKSDLMNEIKYMEENLKEAKNYLSQLEGDK